jgi:hypothetical protein
VVGSDLPQCAGSPVCGGRFGGVCIGSMRRRVAVKQAIVGAAVSSSGRKTPGSALADLLGGLPRLQLSQGMADRRVRKRKASMF